MTCKPCDNKKLKSFSINEKCLTCYESFKDTPDEKVVQLLCSHAFHYDCIYETYKMYSIKYSYNIQKTQYECPYCRSNGGYLPLLEGMKPEKNIHREYEIKAAYLYKYKTWGQCKGICKNGKRCTNKAKKIIGEVCGKHVSQYKPPTIPEPPIPTGPPVLKPSNATQMI